MFTFWIFLLIPWIVLAPLSVMAFDGGPKPEAYVFVWSVWTYPVTVVLMALLKRRLRWIVLFPIINLAGCPISSLMHR